MILQESVSIYAAASAECLVITDHNIFASVISHFLVKSTK